MTAFPVSLASWALTLASLYLGHVLLATAGWTTPVQISILVVAAVTLVAPVVALTCFIKRYGKGHVSTMRIADLYLALIAISANANFDMMFFFGGTDRPVPFSGMHRFMAPGVDGKPPMMEWPDVFLGIVDCFHLSVETLSTVGYGDIVPAAWYAKLLVDCEILLGVGITVVVVGRHFALRSNAAR